MFSQGPFRADQDNSIAPCCIFVPSFLYHKNILLSAHVINLPSNFLQVDIRLDFAKSNSQRAIATSIFTNPGERIQNYSLLLWFRSNSRQPLHLLRKKNSGCQRWAVVCVLMQQKLYIEMLISVMQLKLGHLVRCNRRRWSIPWSYGWVEIGPIAIQWGYFMHFMEPSSSSFWLFGVVSNKIIW